MCSGRYGASRILLSRNSLYIESTVCAFYIHVTVRRYRVILNNQTDALFIHIYSVIKHYMFRETSLPIIRSLLLYIRHW